MNNFSTDPDPVSALWIGILYAVYAVIGIPLNLLVLTLTVTTESVRNVPVNMCIFSLALADMMFLVSCLSSTVWAFTFNVTVCKVMGVGIYIFVIMSMMLPSCLAICRYAAVRDEDELHPFLRPLITRKGIFVFNLIYWTYGLTFTLPFIITDKFGMDEMGCCGVSGIDTAFLWAYYLFAVVVVLFAAYAATFIFYRKLVRWVEETSSLLTISAQKRETLLITRNLLRMIKWLLFIPVVFYYPALTCEAALRIFPNVVSIRTARMFIITMPLPHMCDPIITMIFVKRYRFALFALFSRKGTASNTIVAHDHTCKQGGSSYIQPPPDEAEKSDKHWVE